MRTLPATRLLRPLLAMLVVAALAACGTTAAPSPSASVFVPAAASPGEPLGALPGVEGFAYRTDLGGIPGFLEGARESIGEEIEIEIVQSVVARQDDAAVSVIAFGFPGATDTQSVDYFARILDEMEDGFGAGSERGLGGSAYVMTADGRTAVMAPWGRLDYLVFVFALGPTGPTEDLVSAILDGG